MKHPAYTLSTLATEMSSIRSGAQGGLPCSVPGRTIHRWIKAQKPLSEQARRVADGEIAFDTDPDLSEDDNSGDQISSIRPNQ